MNILISNDDGINSAGINSLAKAFSRLGNVYVVAPEGERSSNSHHLTCVGKVKIEKRDLENAVEAYALWGTPADCVYLGLDFLFKDRIDLVVSGINIGLNVSTDIVYSGTIAAARARIIASIHSNTFDVSPVFGGLCGSSSSFMVKIVLFSSSSIQNGISKPLGARKAGTSVRTSEAWTASTTASSLCSL